MSRRRNLFFLIIWVYGFLISTCVILYNCVPRWSFDVTIILNKVVIFNSHLLIIIHKIISPVEQCSHCSEFCSIKLCRPAEWRLPAWSHYPHYMRSGLQWRGRGSGQGTEDLLRQRVLFVLRRNTREANGYRSYSWSTYKMCLYLYYHNKYI